MNKDVASTALLRSDLPCVKNISLCCGNVRKSFSVQHLTVYKSTKRSKTCRGRASTLFSGMLPACRAALERVCPGKYPDYTPAKLNSWVSASKFSKQIPLHVVAA